MRRLPRFLLATRLTAAFVLAAAVAGAVAGAVFARSLELGLLDGLDLGLRSRAQTLQAQMAGGHEPLAAQLDALTATAGITQVSNADGRVVASSRAAGDAPLLSGSDREHASLGIYIIDAERRLPASAGSRPQDTEVRLLGAPLGGGDLLVVGAPEDTVSDAVHETVNHLLVAGLIGLTLAAVGARLLVGAALRPVEAARRQVEAASRDASAPALADPGGHDEFGRLVRTFNLLLRRQHELLEAERTFTADAGHELRTPLAILSGELELAARPTRTREEVSEALAVAKEETDRLVRLTEQLLLLARGDNQTLVRPVPGDIGDLVRSAVTAVLPLAAAADVEVVVTGPGTVPAEVDPDRLRLAVDNVLRNALRFAPPGSRVEVSVGPAPAQDAANPTGPTGPSCRVRIADSGPGFDEAFLPHAFDRFRRDDQARARAADDSHGAGLGLSIVRAVVEAHGGQVHAGNRTPGPGAVVGFDLPGAGDADGVPAGRPQARASGD